MCFRSQFQLQFPSLRIQKRVSIMANSKLLRLLSHYCTELDMQRMVNNIGLLLRIAHWELLNSVPLLHHLHL